MAKDDLKRSVLSARSVGRAAKAGALLSWCSAAMFVVIKIFGSVPPSC
jgi:hypothetical protein